MVEGGERVQQKIIQKRFPADVTLDENVQTFLRDKKIDAQLYALLQQYSMPVEVDNGVYITVVEKKALPIQVEILKVLEMKSKTTLRAHLNYLIESGYVIEDTNNKRYILPEKENIYFMLPLDTIQFINDTVKNEVYKIYIYLGQRWKYKQGYVFTQEEIAEHLGTTLAGNETVRRQIRNSLIALQNNGLIQYEQFYEGKVPKYRLVNWSVHFVVRD